MLPLLTSLLKTLKDAVAIVESPQATVVPLLTVILKDYNELVEDPVSRHIYFSSRTF